MKYDVRLKDDCIGKYKIYSYRLFRPIDIDIVKSMKSLGDIEIFTHFPKPYFNIKSKYFLVKGVIGNERIDVTYYEGGINQKEKFENILKNIS